VFKTGNDVTIQFLKNDFVYVGHWNLLPFKRHSTFLIGLISHKKDQLKFFGKGKSLGKIFTNHTPRTEGIFSRRSASYEPSSVKIVEPLDV
jgi:hypothetical protein